MPARTDTVQEGKTDWRAKGGGRCYFSFYGRDFSDLRDLESWRALLELR